MGAILGTLFGGSKDSSAMDTLMGMAGKSFNMGAPVQQQGLEAASQAISTGQGVESRQPAIAMATEKSMQASNQARQAMADDFARTGTAGTPWAQQIMGSMQQQGAQAANQIGIDMQTEDFWKTIQAFYPGAGQTMGQGMAGQGQVAGIEQTQNLANQQMMWNLLLGPFA